jgi:hypothetical protein
MAASLVVTNFDWVIGVDTFIGELPLSYFHTSRQVLEFELE